MIRRTPASFTVLLDEVVGFYGGSDGFKRQVMSAYPIYDESHRDILNTKILEHYAYREIGCETVEMFVRVFKRKLNEVMPPFNKLYLSELMEFDPLVTTDMETEGTSSSKNAGTTTSRTLSESNTSNDNSSEQVTKEFPQLQLDSTGDYATSGASGTSSARAIAHSTGDSDDTSSTTSDATDSTHVKGRQADGGQLIRSYRDTILNIDMSVVESLSDCFMLITDNGDSYTRGSYYGYGFGGLWPLWF